MFNNVGNKIKLSAWVVMGIGVVTSIFLGIMCFVTAGKLNSVYSDFDSIFGYDSRSTGSGGGFVVAGILIILFGLALSVVMAWIVNGFGQIVNNSQTLVAQGYGQKTPQPAQAPVRRPAAPAPAMTRPAPQPVYPAPMQQPEQPVYQAPVQQPEQPVYQAPVQQPEQPVYPAPMQQAEVDISELQPAFAEDIIPVTPEESVVPAEPKRTVKYCGQCGTENDADFAFCLKCGSKLD